MGTAGTVGLASVVSAASVAFVFLQILRMAGSAKARYVPEGPPVWICGDFHAGNLGPVAALDGRIAIQIRDLDQTVIGNPRMISSASPYERLENQKPTMPLSTKFGALSRSEKADIAELFQTPAFLLRR
jgi:Uncharacterized protein conserved in bacteria (DUF2252)